MILQEIMQKTQKALAQKMAELPLNVLERALKDSYEPREIAKKSEINIIAEIKKASPSKGVIREDFDPLKIALEYESAGAWAISVLTEPFYFLGSLEYLALVRRYTTTPLLRKDFIFSRYQIAEARIHGADIVLLIAKVMDKQSLRELSDYAASLGLAVLMEIHDEKDLEKALFSNAKLIGINHRNLDDFKIDLELCPKLLPMIPKDKIVVAESGLKSQEMLRELSSLGVSGFLIGEHFMREPSPGEALKILKGEL